MELSVVIPTHNEKENASLLIYLIANTLKGVSYEVIVVDDGSVDGTANACWKVIEKTGTLAQVLVRNKKLGLGNAYKRGVEHAKGNYVLIMDADLSHDPREIPNLLRKIKQTHAEVVIGSRYRAGGGICNWPFSRKITSQGANILAYIFTGKSNTDMTNSYRIYKKDTIAYATQNVHAPGFAYQMEILFHCNKKIEEVPIKFYERMSGVSKLSAQEYFQFLLWGSMLFARRARAFLQNFMCPGTECPGCC